MARLDRLGQTPKEIAQIAAAIGREFSYELLASVAKHREVLSGWALVKNGQAQRGLDRLRAGLDTGLATGHKAKEPYWLALFAEACLETGRVEQGLSAVREAIAETQRTASCSSDAELNRL